MARVPRTGVLLGVVTVLALVAASCGDDGGAAGAPDEGGSLTVYSGREEEFVASLFEQFEADTGTEVDVRYGDSAELAATLVEEGDASPADVFFSQDAGSLGAVAEAGLFAEIDPETLNRVEERFRSPEGLWVGTSGRGRVAVYNTEVLDASELPASILDLADPRWDGKIGLPPTNSSFQTHVAAMMLTIGDGPTRDWLEGLMANGVRFYEDNGATTRAVASGEIEVGLVNHYYKFEVEAEDGSLPISNHYFESGDPGSFVNTAGVGILASSEHDDAAQSFVDYATGEEGQTWVATETWEYPVVPGYEPSVDILAISRFVGPESQVDLFDLGPVLPEALQLLAEVGMV
ncbi:MAG TPA: iron ABC transporter substrate-binding protein [Actinomycetota bacterium]|nr:iron ABC transporter substrate-binding protein [Actinomycetota bacterium]